MLVSVILFIGADVAAIRIEEKESIGVIDHPGNRKEQANRYRASVMRASYPRHDPIGRLHEALPILRRRV